jgi:hypothetical protein
MRPYLKENPMKLIQKISEKIAPQTDANTALARATSIPLGITRTQAQMDALKKWN